MLARVRHSPTATQFVSLKSVSFFLDEMYSGIRSPHRSTQPKVRSNVHMMSNRKLPVRPSSINSAGSDRAH